MATMKAVFDQTPFPRLQLSRDERNLCRSLVRDALRKTLLEYDRAAANEGPPGKRHFSRRRWKVVKTHENCTAYIDRSSQSGKRATTTSSVGGDTSSSKCVDNNSQHSNDSSHSHVKSYDGTGGGDGATTTTVSYSNGESLRSVSSSDMSDNADDGDDDDGDELLDDVSSDWCMPDIVISGTVPGTVDDVLYGMITPDSSEFMLRTAYVDDHIQDGAVLYQMLMPTPDAPFRFFGIKWYVKDIPLQYKKLVWPRDFVFVESLGTLTRRDGTRLGYMIRHPVNLTSCGDLTAHGVIRGSFTSCGIYTQLPNNEVDIYVRGKADPAGKMSKSLGISLTAHALLSASNAPNCSRHKKLMGLIRRAVENVTPTERTTRYACGACAKKFGALTTIKTCKICRLQMCSRCRLRRSLSFVNEDNNFAVEQLMAIICINCLAQATHASAFEIARDEVLSGRYGPVPKEQKQPKQQEDEQQKSAVLLDEFQLKTTLTPTSSADDVSSLQLKVDRITSLKLLKHDILTETLSESSFPSSFDESVTEVVTGDEIDVEGTTAAAASAPGATVTNLLNPNEERQELWRKMSELRLQAESAYQLTKQTTALFNMGMQGATSSADVSVASDADEEEQDEA